MNNNIDIKHNIAVASMAITKGLPIRLRIDENHQPFVVRPHVLKWDCKMSEYYILAGRSIFWLSRFEDVWLMFIEINTED